MKRSIATAAVVLLAFAGLAAQESVKVLAMETAGTEEKDVLHVSLPHLEALATELTAGLLAADLRLLDRQDRVLAALGALKKGKFKWEHKTVQGRFLAVRFAPADAAALAEAIRAGNPRPGIRLAACDDKTGAVVQAVAVAPRDFPDVAVQLNYPVNARPGEALGQAVTATVENLGGVAARDVRLEVVLSGDDRIPVKPASEAPGYAEDVLLSGGRETVALLEPKQQLTVRFPGSLQVPADTPAGKRYLAVVADPEDKLGELSEENNVGSGFIMISVPAPAALVIELPETRLQFKPADYGFEIRCHDVLLSDGKDWKLCRMKPNVFQIQHVSWSGVFWEVDTMSREVYEISGAQFCRKGGSDRDTGIRVEVSGGSLTAPPASFTLKLAKTLLRYEPESKTFLLQAHGRPIFHLPFWWSCRRESYLYQFRYAPWDQYFLEVDTRKQEARLVSGGKFCSAEGEAQKLPWTVKVEP